MEQMVASGRYQNASEVLREGLRLILQREAEDAVRLEALRNAVQVGVSDFEAGRFTSFDSSAALGAHLKSVATKARDYKLGGSPCTPGRTRLFRHPALDFRELRGAAGRNLRGDSFART